MKCIISLNASLFQNIKKNLISRNKQRKKGRKEKKKNAHRSRSISLKMQKRMTFFRRKQNFSFSSLALFLHPFYPSPHK